MGRKVQETDVRAFAKPRILLLICLLHGLHRAHFNGQGVLPDGLAEDPVDRKLIGHEGIFILHAQVAASDEDREGHQDKGDEPVFEIEHQKQGDDAQEHGAGPGKGDPGGPFSFYQPFSVNVFIHKTSPYPP